jgi:PAS domain S-box-containing protein
MVATWYTAHHLGPLVIATDLGSMLLLRGFLIAVAIPTHALEGDSTARRRAEAEVKALNETLERRIKERTLELERSYQRYQLLAANLPNGAVFLFDKDLRFILVDGMALKKCGWDKASMEGKTLREVLPAQFEAVLEPRFRAALAGTADIFEQAFAGHDLLVYTLPVRDAQGGVFAGMALCLDATEHKLARQELRESEERFNAFMRNIPGVAFMKNAEGRYIYASDRVNKVVGLSATEVLGMNVFDFWPADAPRVTAQDEEMRRTGRPIQTVETLPMEDGIHYWLMHKFPIPDSTGNMGLIGGMAIDITARIVAEQKVEAALRKEEVLKKEIHHRVKNNLQVVISMLYLQSAEIADPTAREVLRECQSRTRSIALIYALLSESENLTKIEFLQYARQLTTDLLTAYRANPETTAVTINAEGVFLGLDASLPCGLILTELVSNSLKYAFPGGRKGRIEIDLHPTEDRLLQLTVRDDGVGLPAGFDLENPRTMGYKLVRDLARQLGGEITFSNNNSGAAVTVSFPPNGS